MAKGSFERSGATFCHGEIIFCGLGWFIETLVRSFIRRFIRRFIGGFGLA